KQNDRHIKVLIDIIENESIFPKNRFVPTCINAVVVSNNTIINGTYPNEVVYADSFDDWVKKAKIKWIAKHPHKLFTLKEMMSADEVQSSAKRLLVFDKTISADISTVKQQEEKTHGAKNEENSAERTLDEHLARVINEQFNELNQIQQVTEDKNTLSNSELLRKLKDLRSKLAIQHKVKMLHHIFDNRTLEDFVAKKPQTKEEMLKISGVGLIKFDRYGEAFLYACSSTNADVE
ncbi:MAG: HRDC domain-containing protein, partial [Sulfurimonas sp.]